MYMFMHMVYGVLCLFASVLYIKIKRGTKVHPYYLHSTKNTADRTVLTTNQ